MRILEGKDALIYKMEHFMTILGELLFSLVYYSTINTYLFWKEIQNYEEFFKRGCRSGNRNDYLNGNPYVLQYERH
mgnify:CR=1 FL=1